MRKYSFEYGHYEGRAHFNVDTGVLMESDAQLMLDFFDWEYDKDENPIDELLKKYAMQSIKVATFENFNVKGVQGWFSENEGFLPLDGTSGIKLVLVEGYEFDESSLYMDVVNED